MDTTQRVKNNFLESIQIKTESLDKLAPIVAEAARAMANSLFGKLGSLISINSLKYQVCKKIKW